MSLWGLIEHFLLSVVFVLAIITMYELVHLLHLMRKGQGWVRTCPLASFNKKGKVDNLFSIVYSQLWQLTGGELSQHPLSKQPFTNSRGRGSNVRGRGLNGRGRGWITAVKGRYTRQRGIHVHMLIGFLSVFYL